LYFFRILGGIFRIFLGIFFGGIFWEDLFGRIFLGRFFGRIFGGDFFWEDFFGRNSLFVLLKLANLFEPERN
jgi:hypothetical protein